MSKLYVLHELHPRFLTVYTLQFTLNILLFHVNLDGEAIQLTISYNIILFLLYIINCIIYKEEGKYDKRRKEYLLGFI